MTAVLNLPVEDLHNEVVLCHQKIIEQNQVITEQHQKITYLEEQLAWLKRQIFGKTSERIIDANPMQLEFDGFESVNEQAVQTKTVLAHERKVRSSTGTDTIKLPEDLPVETTVIDLPEK